MKLDYGKIAGILCILISAFFIYNGNDPGAWILFLLVAWAVW